MSDTVAARASRAAPRRTGGFAEADRDFARSVWLGLTLVAVIAIVGPLVSYRSDVAEARTQIRSRVDRSAAENADSLWLHLQVLQAELERVAQRPEVDLRDNTTGPEELLLQLAHHHSALFGGGVAFLDLEGQAVWSEPAELFSGGEPFSSRGWFQRVLAMQDAAVDALGAGTGTFVVAVPVSRAGKATGVLVGLIGASDRLLPPGRSPGESLAVVGRDGEVLLPAPAPAWTRAAGFGGRVEALLALSGGAEWKVDGLPSFASAKAVGTTALRVVLVAQEEPAISAIRGRLLLQLVFIAVLQVLTLVLFTLYLRRTYRTFLAVEARVAEQDKMAALGSAASLIAHEVKNSLNGLNVAASLLSSGADLALPVRSIRGQVDRLAHLASSLLHFGKPAAARMAPMRLDQIAQQALEGLAVLPESADVTIEKRLAVPLAVAGDPLLMVTALDNLVRNAIEAAVAAKDSGGSPSPGSSSARCKTAARRSSPSKTTPAARRLGSKSTCSSPSPPRSPRASGWGCRWPGGRSSSRAGSCRSTESPVAVDLPFALSWRADAAGPRHPRGRRRPGLLGDGGGRAAARGLFGGSRPLAARGPPRHRAHAA